MPDWIIHMGAARVLARPLARPDPRWVLLGAVLPDVVPRLVGYGVDLVAGSVGPPPVHLYLSLLHTPFSVALLAAALVAVALDRPAAWRGLAVGSVLHFALDALQKSFGGGSSLAYPLDLRPLGLQVAWYENRLTLALVVVSGLYLLAVLWREGVPATPPLRAPTRRAATVAAVLTAVCLLAPCALVPRAVAENLRGSRFAYEPEAFEGCAIEIAGSLVEELDERHVVLELMDTPMPIARAGLPPNAYGSIVSLRGSVRGGQIRAEAVFVHDYTFKKVVSLAGALLMLVWWAPGLRQQLRARRTGAAS